MSALFSLVTVVVLAVVAYAGAQASGLRYLFGVVLPYTAIAVFLLGIVYRIYLWARSPVPFRIPTTAGQQKSLSWVKSNELENPHTTSGVVARMALEILFFRSLFRNTKAQLEDGPKLVYGPTKWLWGAALLFHWSFLVIFVRHFKFFAEPVPFFVEWADALDGFFQIGLPILYLTDVLILTAVTYLFLRRVLIPQMKYISLASDYFPLLLIGGIAVSGVYMRYFSNVDIVGVKTLATGLIGGSPVVPATIEAPFFIHLFLVCTLLIYFPFSKLVHMPGVFLSPTRNLANTNRAARHVNPWNYPVKTHTYDEYEDEFRDLMKTSGYPLEKDPEAGKGEGEENADKAQAQ